MNIEQLRQQEKELEALLAENRNKQRELNQAEFIKSKGFDIGDTVEWMDGKNKRKGIISSLEFSGVRPVYYHALLFNSDGKVGKKNVRIWSHELSSLKLVDKA